MTANVGTLGGCLIVVGSLFGIFSLVFILSLVFFPRPHVNLTNSDIEATVTALGDSDVIATYVAGHNGDNPLSCNGSQMPPGSTCIDRDTGQTILSYDGWIADQRARLVSQTESDRDNQNNPLKNGIEAGIALVVCVLAVWGGIATIRNRDKLARLLTP